MHAVDCVARIPAASIRQGLAAYSIRGIIRTSIFTTKIAGLGSAAIKDSDFDYAFHLAAMVGGRLMIENNPLAVADDLAIDAAYWQWATVAQPQKTVCFSSSAAYPIKLQRPDGLRSSEGRHDLLRKRHRHARHELRLGEADLRVLGATGLREAWTEVDLLSAVFRLWRGSGRRLPIPQHLQASARQIAVRKCSRCGAAGTQMRDFIHIEDCVDGVMTTMDKIDDGGAVNLSTGILTSFIDFAKLAAEIVGYHPRVTGLSDKPAGVHARGGDTTKQKQLGFEYTTRFRNGIERALKDYSEPR